MNAQQPVILGMSLKMYFDFHQTVDWSTQVAAAIRQHPAVVSGATEIFLLPAFPMIPTVEQIFEGTTMAFGAQDLHWEDSGAYTGEVSAKMLQQMRCRYVEVGHAERRRYFHEDDEVIAAKTAAALRNQLIPVLCIGESEQGTPDQAVATCLKQIDRALSQATQEQASQRIIIAYEPVFSIGASSAAPYEYVCEVCSTLRGKLHERGIAAQIIYGGSAGPGLLEKLSAGVDGLFLGRFAHDPRAFLSILDEVQEATKQINNSI